MPDTPRYEPYPVSGDQIRGAARRIEAAMQPGSNDDPREWLDLPDRHRHLLEHLNTLVEETRLDAALDDEVVASTARGPVQALQE